MAKSTLKVTAEITHIPEEKGSVLAYASITIADSFVVYGVKLIETKDKTFVAMPSRSYEQTKGKKKETKYTDICFPITKEFRKAIEDAVIEAYNDEIND